MAQFMEALREYVTFKDAKRYVASYERLITQADAQDLASRIGDYTLHGAMFLPRIGAFVPELHGMYRIIQGDYVGGLFELGTGLAIHVFDFRKQGRRRMWMDIFDTATEKSLVSEVKLESDTTVTSLLEYVTLKDAVRYARAYESVAREMQQREPDTVMYDYWLHAGIGISRLSLVGFEVDGARRIMEGQVTIGALELGFAVAGQFLDYRRKERRKLWTGLFKKIEEKGLAQEVFGS